MEASRFLLREQTGIPCLSWCARVPNGERAILLHHGRAVEAEDTSFFEGAWASDFAGRDFAAASFFTGSGGFTTADGVEFATSTHTLAPIFLLKRNAEVVVSNSLVFLLTQTEAELDLQYKFYASDLMSIMEGIRHYVQSIPTRTGEQIEIFYFCNLHIGRNGIITRKEKTLPPAFKDYADYCRFLNAQVQAVAANARDSRRKIRYEPITTISSGYDSTTASALAKTVGCRQAISFKLSRDGGRDSGSEVAKRLGLEVLEFDREQYRKDDGSEIEFLAAGTGGEDMVMAPLATLFAGRLVFTGFYGLIWDRLNEDAGPDLLKSDASGCSMEEFRLRVGFLHFPVPYIGCRRHRDIIRISQSPELKPWRSGDEAYDKPIPRRFLQEIGIPGHLFGQKKRAATQPFITVGRDDPMPREVLTAKSFSEFHQFMKGVVFFRGPGERVWLLLMRKLYSFNRFLLRACRQAGLARKARVMVPAKFRKRITEQHLIFPWAVGRLKESYRLRESEPAKAASAAVAIRE